MSRIIENLFSSTHFNNLPGIHNRYTVSHSGNYPKVMGDEDNRCIDLLLQILHQIENLCLNGYVERSCRLVGNQQLRVGRKCHSDYDTLTHPAAELMRILLKTAFR
ncbi:hypothetical protein D3C80_1812010 [compost metagenome]